MPEISEGTEVITPRGLVYEVEETYKNAPADVAIYNSRACRESFDSLVKVDHPIRVKVSRQCYAESLVEMAEEAGFVNFEGDFDFTEVTQITIYPMNDSKCQRGFEVYDKGDHDLTYRDDLPQIEGWLQYHSESDHKISEKSKLDREFEKGAEKASKEFRKQTEKEQKAKPEHAESEDDECDDCKRIRKSNSKPIMCPIHDPATPTDESEEYDGPRPEDVVEQYKEHRIESDSWVASTDSWKNASQVIRHFGSEKPDCDIDFAGYLLDVIEDLEQELEDIKDDRDYWHNNFLRFDNIIDSVEEERDNLQERIKEARERIKQTWNHKTNKLLNDLLGILSGSDEGDEHA